MDLIFMRAITHLGNFVLWIFISLILYWFGRKEFAKFFIAAILLGYILNGVLKYSLQLPRPPSVEWLIGVESPYGFPSGHAAIAFLAATIFTLESRRFAFLYALAFLVAYSRVFLGVHYLVDVIGGAAVGTIVAAIAWGIRRSKLRVGNRTWLACFWLVASLPLYLYFPIKPMLIGGFTLGFGFSLITSVECKAEGVMKAFWGCVSALLMLAVYNLVDVPLIRGLAAFAFIAWSLTLYPYVYGKLIKKS